MALPDKNYQTWKEATDRVAQFGISIAEAGAAMAAFGPQLAQAWDQTLRSLQASPAARARMKRLGIEPPKDSNP